MLALGREKIKKRGVDQIIQMGPGDSEGLPFEDNAFDAVIVGFSVRNFENPLKGLAEMYRVTRPNGTCLVLEFSNPSRFPYKQLYSFYSRQSCRSSGNASARTRQPTGICRSRSKRIRTEATFCGFLSRQAFDKPGGYPSRGALRRFI